MLIDIFERLSVQIATDLRLRTPMETSGWTVSI